MTDSEKMREAAARWCADEADRCEDAAKWGGHRKYVQDCKAAAFALRNAASKIGAISLAPPHVDDSPDTYPVVNAAIHIDHAAVLAEAMKLPEVVALVEAATPYVSPVQNADYGRQMRQYEALVAALTALKGKSHE